jgi:H+/Cl- antiporter ClcA
MTGPDSEARRPGPSHRLSLSRTRRPARTSERQRRPHPLLKQRMPSGRGAMEQPNITSAGAGVLTLRFWVMVMLAGVAAGLLGALMMAILFNVQYAAFGYHEGSLQYGTEHAPAARRVASLLIAGAFGGVAWFLLRRYTRGQPSEIDESLWNGDGHLSFRRSLGTSVISEVVIGMGASIGREAAPKLLGGASGSLLAGWAGLSAQQRRLLVACAGGAGLAAVYNVPLAGALFTAEILLGSITLPVMLPAIACSAIATATAWIYLPDRAVYPGIPDYRFTWSVMTWALLAGPVIGLISAGYIRLIGWVSHHRARGTRALFAPVIAFGILGVIGIWYPQLFGNGLDMARDAFLGVGGFSLLLILFALKPLVTAMCLGSGASGGLFTPTLATGAVLGGALGIAWNLAWPGSPSGAFAMVCAAAMIGAAMQAPLSGLALVLELTHSGFGLMVPMMAATGIATLVAFHVDGYSIYSARLPAFADDSAPAAAAGSHAPQGSRSDPGRSLQPDRRGGCAAAAHSARVPRAARSGGRWLSAALPRWRPRPGYGDSDLAGSARRRARAPVAVSNTAMMTAIPPGRAAAGGMVNMARGLRTALGVEATTLPPAAARRRVRAGRNSRAVRVGGHDSRAVPR